MLRLGGRGSGPPAPAPSAADQCRNQRCSFDALHSHRSMSPPPPPTCPAPLTRRPVCSRRGRGWCAAWRRRGTAPWSSRAPTTRVRVWCGATAAGSAQPRQQRIQPRRPTAPPGRSLRTGAPRVLRRASKAVPEDEGRRHLSGARGRHVRGRRAGAAHTGKEFKGQVLACKEQCCSWLHPEKGRPGGPL